MPSTPPSQRVVGRSPVHANTNPARCWLACPSRLMPCAETKPAYHRPLFAETLPPASTSFVLPLQQHGAILACTPFAAATPGATTAVSCASDLRRTTVRWLQQFRLQPMHRLKPWLARINATSTHRRCPISAVFFRAPNTQISVLFSRLLKSTTTGSNRD